MHLCTKQVLKDLDIEQWADQAGNKLSGGLQRLTSFAMAVAYPSDIILLDEPTNDVDPIRRKLIWQYMRKLAKKGHMIFVVTHNLLEVEQYVSNVMIVSLHDMDELHELPEVETREYKEDEMQLVLTLSENQVPSAVNWLMELNKTQIFGAGIQCGSGCICGCNNLWNGTISSTD